jgi:hypothetical protein
VYNGDVNGDGYPGVGGALDRTNDLIHVPEDPFQAPLSLITAILFTDAIKNDPCLAKHVGELVARNGCRAPWENRLDLRLAHTMSFGGRDIRLEADVINVLNVVNSSWGQVQTVSPVVPLIDLCSVSCDGPLPARWGAAVLPTPDDEGNLRAPDPWTTVSPDSQWQMQFGMRVTLGGNR